jgi:hypothetical protein
MEPIDNTGILLSPPLETDYIAGDVSQIDYSVVNPSGNWSRDIPRNESQRESRIETMACVSFSANNVIEFQVNRMLRLNLIPPKIKATLEDLNYVKENQLNLSDRFLAWKSETTINGNYLNKVAQTVRTFGAVPEEDWPFINEPWDIFYKKPPKEVQEKASTFLNYFNVQYEWVSTSINPQSIGTLEYHLKQAPLQVALATCSPWDNFVDYCGKTGTNHAVTLHDIREDKRLDIFDHYRPYYSKSLAPGYPIPAALKILVTLKDNISMKFSKLVVSLEKEGEIYAISSNGKRHHISNYRTLLLGKEDGFWSFEKVEDLPKASPEEWALPEGAEVHLDPHD